MPKKETISVEGSRAIWSGNLGIGVMSIPVKVFPAVTKSEVKSLKQICPDCKTGISKKNHCGSCQKEVAFGDLKKGYKLDKETIVEIEPHEMDYVKGNLTTSIKASGFVDNGHFDFVQMDKPYYVVPESQENFSQYNLLVKGLQEFKKNILVKMALRTSPSYAVISVKKGRLVMSTLRYDNELKDIEKIPTEQTQVSSDELSVFKQIVNGMSLSGVTIDNDIEDRFKDLVEKKLAGTPLDIPKPKPVLDNI